jgi:hypothetical protein
VWPSLAFCSFGEMNWSNVLRKTFQAIVDRDMQTALTVPILFGVPIGVVAALSTINPTAAILFHKIYSYFWLSTSSLTDLQFEMTCDLRRPSLQGMDARLYINGRKREKTLKESS